VGLELNLFDQSTGLSGSAAGADYEICIGHCKSSGVTVPSTTPQYFDSTIYGLSAKM